MSLIYIADLKPSKDELIAAWIPRQPWAMNSDTSGLERVGAYRFDDPAGAVGVETHLLRSASGTVFQVPLTYRSEPLDGADAYVVGTTDHSILGKRWVYDGVGDPVYVSVTVHAIVDGAQQAELIVEFDGVRSIGEATASVHGSGTGDIDPGPPDNAIVEHKGSRTTVETASFILTVHRVIDAKSTEAPQLSGTWTGQESASTLVVLALPAYR